MHTSVYPPTAHTIYIQRRARYIYSRARPSYRITCSRVPHSSSRKEARKKSVSFACCCFFQWRTSLIVPADVNYTVGRARLVIRLRNLAVRLLDTAHARALSCARACVFALLCCAKKFGRQTRRELKKRKRKRANCYTHVY